MSRVYHHNSQQTGDYTEKVCNLPIRLRTLKSAKDIDRLRVFETATQNPRI